MHYYFNLKRPAISYVFSMWQYCSTSNLQPALNKQSGWFRNFRLPVRQLLFQESLFLQLIFNGTYNIVHCAFEAGWVKC
jgi:hypothetical protein